MNLENLWWQNEQQLTTYPLDLDINVDVLVVGAGYSGLSSALHLAQQGVNVAVVEASHIGSGASGRSVGLTNAGLWIMPQQAEKLLGVTAGRALNQLLIDAPLYVAKLIKDHQLDCDFLNNGTLHLAHSVAAMQYLHQRQSQLEVYGAKLELLDKATVYAKTQASGYFGALQDSRAGTLQPLKYCRELARLASLAGAKIYSQTQVCAIDKQGEKLVISTGQSQIIASKVILATNAYEQQLSYNQDLYTPLYYSQLASQPLSVEQRQQALPSNQGCWDTGTVMRSFRTDATGRLIIGTVGNIHCGDAQGFKRWSQHVVSKTFPALGQLEYQYGWSGRIAKSSNNIPQVIEIDNNILQIMGYSGRGIAGATVAGRELAHYITGKISKTELALPINQAKAISFNQLRAAVYEVGCQLSHLSDHLLR